MMPGDLSVYLCEGNGKTVAREVSDDARGSCRTD